MDDDRRVRFVRLCRRQRVAIWRPLPCLRYRLFKCISKSARGRVIHVPGLRLLPQFVMLIVRLLADHLTRPTNRSVANPTLLQVVLVLHCLASGAFLNVVSRVVGVSIPTASRVLLGFVSAVVVVRNNQTITLIVWPTTPETIRRAKRGFYALNIKYPSPVFVKYL